MSKLILLEQIKNKFDVRVAMSQDRVIQFAGMYEAGVHLPPIEIVEIAEDEYAIIDGRTRAAAREYLNLKDVPAVIKPTEDAGSMYAQALLANWGGALPPTRADIQHTVVRMLESGMSAAAIGRSLVFIPASSLRSYIHYSVSALSRRKIAVALDMIRDEGATVEAAAKRTGLPLKRLQDILSGKKGKWGGNRTEESQTLAELKIYISATLHSASAGISKKLQGLLQMVDDGDISARGASTVLIALREHLRKTGLRVVDWESRLNALKSSQASALRKLLPEESEPEPAAAAKKGGRPRRQPGDPKGTRISPGFWESELPKAIRVSGHNTPSALGAYFASIGHPLERKLIEAALYRLRKRGLVK